MEPSLEPIQIGASICSSIVLTTPGRTRARTAASGQGPRPYLSWFNLLSGNQRVVASVCYWHRAAKR